MENKDINSIEEIPYRIIRCNTCIGGYSKAPMLQNFSNNFNNIDNNNSSNNIVVNGDNTINSTTTGNNYEQVIPPLKGNHT